tara:strand:+ start:9011 stop:9472 length:462 start_codon:yes stop_codon:yes gene_type:complete
MITSLGMFMNTAGDAEPIAMSFFGRAIFSRFFRFCSRNMSSIVNFVFASFRKMPVRVGLAIVGSILLLITFLVGFLWAYISAFEQEELTMALRNSLTPILIIVLIWISIATFIPSLERQPEVIHVTEEPSTEIIEVQPNPVVIEDDEEAELVE